MKPVTRRTFLSKSTLGVASLTAGASLFTPSGATLAADPSNSGRNGMLALKTRRRRETTAGSGEFEVTQQTVDWKGAQTAVVIVDMWDKHWCVGATRRVGQVAPQMNAFANVARDRGALIIHAPSSCTKPYKDHPAHKLALGAPAAATLPKDIGEWCYQIKNETNGKYPIDQTDGGCDCEPKCEGGSPWRRQVAAIKIHDVDAISDSGVEIWNLIEHRGIRNVMIFGVHTNMCVLGRPFGLRQMSQNGKNTLLVRDLTDTMYNSKAWPYVNHFQGTDLIIEHIEKFVCATTTSASLLGDKPFRFPEDARPLKTAGL